MIWPDPSKAERAEMRDSIRKNEERLFAHTQRIDTLSDQINALQETIAVLKKLDPASVPKEMETRLTALELWKVQIMGLLMEKSAAGRPVLSKTGKGLRAFYGK